MSKELKKTIEEIKDINKTLKSIRNENNHGDDIVSTRLNFEIAKKLSEIGGAVTGSKDI